MEKPQTELRKLKGKRMRINYNATAMMAVNALNKNDENLSVSTGKLSSGYKINRAKDNPSGYAMSRRMKAQLEGLEQAKENSSRGISVVKTIDGALSEVHDMLQRMNELSIKAANGPLSDNDRELIDEEVQKLKDEVQRISDTMEFNGQKLLDGSFALKAYVVDGGTDALTSDDLAVISYSDRIVSGVYIFDLTDMDELFEAGEFIGDKVLDQINKDNEEIIKFNDEHPAGAQKDLLTLKAKVEVTKPDNSKVENVTISKIQGTVMTLVGDGGFEVDIDIKEEFGAVEKAMIDFTGLGPMTLQVGANEGQTLDIEIPSISVKALGIDTITLKSYQITKEEKDEGTTPASVKDRNALDAIEKVSAAINKVSAIRAKLGAYQNRLETTETSLETNYENMTSAYSGILDTDMSEEYTNYCTHQILSQASTSVLAQANERPSTILQLLQ